MSDPMELFSQVAVRHRGEGLLRLELPPSLRHPAVGRYLTAGLQAGFGVRRVGFDPEGGRLAIHYLPTMTDDRRIARLLAELLVRLKSPSSASPIRAPIPLGVSRPSASRSLKERLLAIPALKNTLGRVPLWRAQALVIRRMIGQQMENRPALQIFGKRPETAVINFINEMVTFYLIRVHWDRITKVWLRNPLGHYKEWLALGYLVFLLVRSRRREDDDDA
ncbi:hypothetical protein SIID45300_00481 [Candidatus Magnetaquicoccaceae bacterium FCR-1]|uniref:Uncharacterized protein n=1 Tax=Candidatus Magnetaquiglobus chichijimensis TaxID=3141448 RepID=A0ABQ0C5K8_9PROT